MFNVSLNSLLSYNKYIQRQKHNEFEMLCKKQPH